MMTAVYIIAMLVGVAGIGMYIGFVVSEGKDERGQAIIAKSSQIAFIFILLGFVFQSVYIQFGSPNLEQIRLMITIWMASIFISNGISILFFQKRM